MVTTSRFTQPAVDRSRQLNVQLIDGDTLVQLVSEYNAKDLVEHYIGVNAADLKTWSYAEILATLIKIYKRIKRL
ncbi:restriction endonuclease [Saliphagus sp. GCM10025308]